LIDAASDYSGGELPNSIPMLSVFSGEHTKGQVYRWKKLSVPYYIGRYFTPSGGRWKIDPGVEIVMGSEAWLTVEGNAVVEAIGTAADPIIIRGRQRQAGYWDGIEFDQSPHNNRFEHVNISDFGNTNNLSSTYAAINMYESKLALNEVTISNGLGRGIRCDDTTLWHDGSFVRFEANVFITDITGTRVDQRCQSF